jgi:hypothetical protein
MIPSNTTLLTSAIRIDPIILALATLRSVHQPRVGHQHFVPATADDFLHPCRVGPHFHHHARRIQPLEEGCQILLRRPQLSFRERFSLQSQNAVMAPLVPQIHSHRQTVEIGAKLTALMLFSGARCCHLFRIQLFFQLSYPVRKAIDQRNSRHNSRHSEVSVQ